MSDSFSFRRVIDIDPDREHPDSFPALEHKQFQFSLIAVGQEMKFPDMVQLIETETGLGVGKVHSRLKSEPEIGELVGEYVFVWYILAPQCAATYNQRVRM